MNKFFAGLTAAAALLLGSSAQAQPMLEFQRLPNLNVGNSGTIEYTGSGEEGDAPLTGTDIGFNGFVNFYTDVSSDVAGSAALTNAVLNFTTGNFVGLVDENGNAIGWAFDGGGEITVTGDVVDAGITGETLLTGTFVSATVEVTDVDTLKVTISSFVDTKNETLLEYFGLPTDVEYEGTMTIDFSVVAGITPGEGFTSTGTQGANIRNIPGEPLAAPEPGTLAMAGFATLVGLAYGYRRRRTTGAPVVS